MERWTCSDTGRAIRGRLTAPMTPEPAACADAALLTLAKLLTGAGGVIEEAEMRDLETWLQKQTTR